MLHYRQFPTKDGSSSRGWKHLLDGPNNSGSCTDCARRGKEYSRPGSPTPFEAGLPSQASITGCHFMRHRLHLLNKARIGVVKASKSRANNKREQFHGLPRSHSFLSSDNQQRSYVSSNASPQLCHVSWFYRIQDPP